MEKKSYSGSKRINLIISKVFLLLTFILLSTQKNYGQTCTCETNFNWVKKTFEDNDAGFKYIINKKGKDAYQVHNQLYLQKIKKLPNNRDCAEAINQWIRFFRNGHIGINYLGKDNKAVPTASSSTKPVGLKKIDSERNDVEKDSKGYMQLNAKKPFFEKIDSTTAYLRIPFFEISEKPLIDSIIAKNRNTILSTQNLIIDVRNNPGGSDASYENIIPFLYTNPIRIVGAEFLSTKLNNQRMLDLSNNTEFDEESRKTFKAYYEKLNQALGQFVNLFEDKISIETKDTVYAYPKKVAILIHEGNGSTTEQFLLAAKQSQKVKLYGRTTRGMLDISNINIIASPCKDIELYYGLSKSFRVPGFVIDDIGLQPDYFIDPTISDYGWVDHVISILNIK